MTVCCVLEQDSEDIYPVLKLIFTRFHIDFSRIMFLFSIFPECACDESCGEKIMPTSPNGSNS